MLLKPDVVRNVLFHPVIRGLAIRGSNPQDDKHGRSVGRSGTDNDGVFHTQY